MFTELVETQQRKTKGKSLFFIGAAVLHILVLSGAFIASIMLPEVSVAATNTDNYEVTWVKPEEFKEKPQPKEQQKLSSDKPKSNGSPSPGKPAPTIYRTEISVNRPVVPTGQVASKNARDVNPKLNVVLSNVNVGSGEVNYPIGNGGTNLRNGNGGDAPSVSVVDAGTPPPPIVKPTPKPTPEPTPVPTPKKVVVVSKGVINGSAIVKPEPTYPAIAKAARAQGRVAVSITVDENGNVVSANATSGHPLLQREAVNAARRAKFKPTLLSGNPVKVQGVITYDFILN